MSSTVPTISSFPLHYKEGTGGGGDLFEFNDVLYRGARGQPGSVSPRPDAHRVQLRLSYEIGGQVFTDASCTIARCRKMRPCIEIMAK
jgi:hypothetical protein